MKRLIFIARPARLRRGNVRAKLFLKEPARESYLIATFHVGEAIYRRIVEPALRQGFLMQGHEFFVEASQ